MKNALLITLVLLILFSIGYTQLASDETELDTLLDADGAVALPWNIKVLDDGSSEVFNIHIGSSSFEEAINLWGTPESIALFSSQGIPQSVEAYFKDPPTGPMKAAIVLTLAVTEEEMQAISSNTTGQTGTKTGDAKYSLAKQDQEKMFDHTIETLTYIPAYHGLEAAFFEERLGKPAATHIESESAVSWYYPEKGLTLLIDSEGKEVFQYESPIHFKMHHRQLLKNGE